MKLSCIQCSSKAKWELELPDGARLYACNKHVVKIRAQFEFVLEGIENPQQAIDMLAGLVKKKHVAQDPDNE